MERPNLPAFVELLKPITWFAPMWAFGCGVVSAGVPLAERWLVIIAGILLAGPLLTAMSQAVNDWFDRHVDAINEPDRPIPSGRIPGRWGLYIAIAWTVLSLIVAALLGPWVLGAARDRHNSRLALLAHHRSGSSRAAGGVRAPWACLTKVCRGSPVPR